MDMPMFVYVNLSIQCLIDLEIFKYSLHYKMTYSNLSVYVISKLLLATFITEQN